jgi:tRNA (guanine37-N1)-methyltransferase
MTLDLTMKSFDIMGNTAFVRFSEKFTLKDKKKFAEKIMKDNQVVKTVLEKKENIKGRLRKLSTNFIAGENTKEILYRENGCSFRFNIDETYFSPRLSNERKEIASKIKKNAVVLVMFAGVAPFSIVIAKNSKAKKVFSNELNREANKYAELNIKLNK